MRTLTLGLLTLALTGCGTVQNFTGNSADGRPPLEVYGGVKRSLETWDPESDCHAAAPVSSSARHAANVAGSAVADTVTLPITATVQTYRVASRCCAMGLWLLFVGDVNPPSNKWREFWFDEQPAQASTEGTP